ncbi:MAG: LacI family DNA-binding transcriptional regulator [bacterium]
MTDINNDSAKRVTLQIIAEHCGVTKGAVSLALRGNTRISAATTERIVAAAMELGYNPALHDAARRLALLRNNTRVLSRVVAAFFPFNFYARSEEFLSEMFRGMLDVLEEEGYGLLVNYTRGESDNAELLPVFSRSDVDGAIIFSRGGHAPQFQAKMLRSNAGFMNRPIVSMLSALPGCALVNTDDFNAAFSTAKYLLEIGHRYIVQCVYLESSPNAPVGPADRINGVKKALEEFGLNPDKHLRLFEIESTWTRPNTLPSGYHINSQPALDAEMVRRLKKFISDNSEFTAILALNDPSAFNIWCVLSNAGISVPDQVSIVGYDDNYPVLDENGNNLLSSVRVPLNEVGREAARLVVEMINGKTPSDEKRVLENELVVRASIAPPGQ